jgi:hypothetical protein
MSKSSGEQLGGNSKGVEALQFSCRWGILATASLTAPRASIYSLFFVFLHLGMELLYS